MTYFVPQTLDTLAARGPMVGTDLLPSLPAGGTMLERSAASDVQNFVLNTVQQFGGSNDAAFAAAATSGLEFFIPAGNYTLAASHTFPARVTFAKGAILTVVSGQTLTFAGGISAPISQIFSNALSGQGSIVLNDQTTPLGYPEWWGAVANASGTDCAAPATAAVRSGLKRVRFGSADYWFSSTFVIDVPYVEVFGVGMWWGAGGTGGCTRLLANFATGPCVRLGPATSPGGANTYQRNNWLHHLNISRGVAYTAPAIGSEASGPTGLLAQYCIDYWIDHVRCEEHNVGFNFTSTVTGYIYRCHGFRSGAAGTVTSNATFTGAISGTTLTASSVTGTLGIGCRVLGTGVTANTAIIGQNSGPTGGAGVYVLNLASTVSSETMTAPYDPFWGMFINGQNGIGPPNGNASMYIQNCGASTGGTPVVLPIGMQITEYLEDTFIRDFETSACAIGMNIKGQASLTAGNLNVQIDHAVLDTCSVYGIVLDSASTCSINIVNCYVAPTAGATSQACYVVSNCSGAITLSNNEADCVANTVGGGGVCQGFYYTGSNGIISSGNRAVDCQRPLTVTNCTDSSFTDIVANENNAGSGVAVSLSGTNKYLYVRTIVRGKANAFTSGVNLNSTTTTLSECNMTGVDPGCISVAGAKLVYNAGNIVATGAFGTNNLASGVIA